MGAVGTWLVSLAGPFVRKILLSLGIGVASYAALAAALNSALSSAKTAFAGIGGDTLLLIQLAGLPDFISIIAGALIAKVAMGAVKKLEILR
jgi:hypothetical protein